MCPPFTSIGAYAIDVEQLCCKHINTREMKVLTCRNSKTFFSYVNKKLYQSHVISKLQFDDGTCIFDEGEIANIFSTEFCKNYSSARVNII